MTEQAVSCLLSPSGQVVTWLKDQDSCLERGFRHALLFEAVHKGLELVIGDPAVCIPIQCFSKSFLSGLDETYQSAVIQNVFLRALRAFDQGEYNSDLSIQCVTRSAFQVVKVEVHLGQPAMSFPRIVAFEADCPPLCPGQMTERDAVMRAMA
jgi:hypothetical protein